MLSSYGRIFLDPISSHCISGYFTHPPKTAYNFFKHHITWRPRIRPAYHVRFSPEQTLSGKSDRAWTHGNDDSVAIYSLGVVKAWNIIRPWLRNDHRCSIGFFFASLFWDWRWPSGFIAGFLNEVTFHRFGIGVFAFTTKICIHWAVAKDRTQGYSWAPCRLTAH